MIDTKDNIQHITFMKIAIEMAKNALSIDEVPIGAVLVDNKGEILSQSFNKPISLSDPTAHAEILCIRDAAKKIGNYRLLDTSLYVTIEPCIMCAGAIIHSRIKRVIFGVYDPKFGAFGSIYNLSKDNRLNHRVEVIDGILRVDCAKILQDFFKRKREK